MHANITGTGSVVVDTPGGVQATAIIKDADKGYWDQMHNNIFSSICNVLIGDTSVASSIASLLASRSHPKIQHVSMKSSPPSVILLEGPSGCGKTSTVLAAMKAMGDTRNPTSIIQVECASISNADDATTLLKGAQPGTIGYDADTSVGHRIAHAITTGSEQGLICILLDEFDKMPKEAACAFTGLLDTGTLQLNDASIIHLPINRTFIFLTSNFIQASIVDTYSALWGSTGWNEYIDAFNLDDSNIHSDFFSFALVSDTKATCFLNPTIQSSLVGCPQLPTSEKTRLASCLVGAIAHQSGSHLVRRIPSKLIVPPLSFIGCMMYMRTCVVRVAEARSDLAHIDRAVLVYFARMCNPASGPSIPGTQLNGLLEVLLPVTITTAISIHLITTIHGEVCFTSECASSLIHRVEADTNDVFFYGTDGHLV
jgi:energy-coupling factor transporter ATP-binding protein EcfA2